MQLDYFVVDVFSDTVLAGNPLAVVLNTANLTAERMQAIAREFNLSETTFVERRPAAVEADRRNALSQNTRRLLQAAVGSDVSHLAGA